MNQNTDYTPVALYARVSSDRQDVDLSIAAQLRALRDYANKNGYIVAREYVDEAESGRIADRPEFRKMIDAATKPSAPFQEILVWKFSRFTRKREYAVAFKSMLRRKGVRVVSITEHADDTPTGKLMEAIIESVDEFYSENLAQEVTRGMRESASRGFWVSSYAPFGYNRVMVQDGAKKRPTLQPDPDASRIVKRIFDMAEAGNGMVNITRTLNDEGILSPRGKLWGKTSVHAILINESYTGTLVWGTHSKDNAEPVRVEKAFPAIVTKAQFSRVNKLMRSRAPKKSHPRRVGSTYLLSGLVKCKTCNRALSGQDAKSGQFAYYVCQSIMKRGKDACDTPRLNARRFEELVVDKIRSNILTEGSITELVKVVDEEMDGIAQDQRKRLRIIEDELENVKRRLGRIWNAIETTPGTEMAAAAFYGSAAGSSWQDHYEPLRLAHSHRLCHPRPRRAVLQHRSAGLGHAPLTANAGVWTAPYFDEGGSEIWMITRSVPVRDDEGVFALVTTDLPVDTPAQQRPHSINFSLPLVLPYFSVPSLVRTLPIIGILEQTVGAVQRDTASASSLATVNAGTGPPIGPHPLCK